MTEGLLRDGDHSECNCYLPSATMIPENSNPWISSVNGLHVNFLESNGLTDDYSVNDVTTLFATHTDHSYLENTELPDRLTSDDNLESNRTV